MSSGIDSLFGPLGKQYCLYFYALSAVGLICIIFIAFAVIVLLFLGKKEHNIHFYPLMGSIIFYVLFYLQNRLLYNICSQTL